MFQDLPNRPDFPRLEEDILEFWKANAIYEKSLANRADAKPFVFFEGPPTANGLPHPGHCLTRAIKDLFPRYRTMRGYRCERKAGWDTHGLPVEVEVCKELGIHRKEEIEAFGIEPFIHQCQASVWRYMKQWEQLTERLGFWIHLEDAYVTYHQSYVESVWWSLKSLFDRGLLYEGYKIVWWWAQGGTALSAGEVGEGYRPVADPSVFIRFPLLDEDASLLVWTTTPWTLPSNQFAAVRSQIEYATVEDVESGEQLVLAADLVEKVSAKAGREWKVISTRPGSELLGLRYRPPFDYYYAQQADEQGSLLDGGTQHLAWRVVEAPFVTTESGTGIVHQAPAFGQDDYEVLLAEQTRFAEGEGPRLICAVGPDGRFTSDVPDFEGVWVKDADKDITRALREAGVLYHLEQYLHDYPFCWRADQDPLIQYPRKSWFIRTTEFKEQLLANNCEINWLPEHIKRGRFGNFLESNVDWALSRERFWGTPLPIWVCSETGKREAVAQYDEVLKKPGLKGTEVWEQAKAANPDLPDDLRVHKPYIDAITYDSPFAQGARMERVTEVIDCWYDSGAMPFAQWGYPHQNRDAFEAQFPADFISEAIDQTRGWFYSLLAISTLLHGKPENNADNREDGQLVSADGNSGDPLMSEHELPHPFRNCIVLGLMLAEAYACRKCDHRHLTEVRECEKCGGKVDRKVEKMSKKLRNYREPQQIFDNHGADALRWYFFANQAPWSSIIYSERAIKESSASFRLTLWNVYKFFVLNANADNFFVPESWISGDAGQLTSDDLSRAESYRPLAERDEIDRWILSELHATAAALVDRMDNYDNFAAAQRLESFVELLSNWWLRRSRDRLWSSDNQSVEKLDAAWTLYECLITVTKLVAPFTPFMAEMIWSNLAGGFGERAVESVHLCDYPTGDERVIDETLSQQMGLLRQIASLGLSARIGAKLKTRQPLARVEVIRADSDHQQWLSQHDALLREELNVESIEYAQSADHYIDYEVHPNFKRLGARLRQHMPAVKKWLNQADGASLLADMDEAGKICVQVDGAEFELDNDDIEIRMQAKPGWAAAGDRGCVVVLATELTDELIRKGRARDLVRMIQEVRKELDCQYTDRIEVGIVGPWDETVIEHAEFIGGETLAVSVTTAALDNVPPRAFETVEGNVSINVKIVTT